MTQGGSYWAQRGLSSSFLSLLWTERISSHQRELSLGVSRGLRDVSACIGAPLPKESHSADRKSKGPYL